MNRYTQVSAKSFFIAASFGLLLAVFSERSYAGQYSDCCDLMSCGSHVNCECGSGIDDRWFLFPQDPNGLSIRGWLNGGFIGNTSSPNSKFNGPYNAVDRSNEAMFNQAYLITEYGLPRCGCGIGGRVDLLYGEDFFLAESIGMEKRPDGSPRWNNEYYGLAIPQAYVSFGSEELSVQVGHFYSVVGYEGVMAPDNFFYSKAYSYQFAGPFTHWGTQANWRPSDSCTVTGGLHNGWDALDRASDSIGFVGKIRFDSQSTGAWSSFAIVTGDDFSDPAGILGSTAFTNRTRYSWLAGLPLADRLDYVFHHWLGLQEDGGLANTRAWWYGIDQYLYYTISNHWQAGARFEWFRDEDGTRVGLNRARNLNNPPFPGSFYSLSLGLNWKPTGNLVIRPEVRADWYDGDAAPSPFQDGTNDSQFMLGFDGILMF